MVVRSKRGLSGQKFPEIKRSMVILFLNRDFLYSTINTCDILRSSKCVQWFFELPAFVDVRSKRGLQGHTVHVYPEVKGQRSFFKRANGDLFYISMNVCDTVCSSDEEGNLSYALKATVDRE